MGGEGGYEGAPTYGELAVATGELCQQVIQLEAERDAAQGQAARLAHVLHAVDQWVANSHDDARADLRAIVGAARDEQQLTDPYARAMAAEAENARLREALRHSATDPEVGANA